MTLPVEIVVVGSGAAGIAAAVTAARAGLQTLVLDHRSSAGGTGGFTGLTTLCGLYDDGGDFLNEGFSREFAEALNPAGPLKMGRVWVLPYRPEKFREVSANFFDAMPKLQARWGTPLNDVSVEGNRITRLNGFNTGAVIDCTGTAEVARAIGSDCLATDESTQAPAIIFPLRNVTRALSSPIEAAQVLLPVARAGLPALHFHPSLEPGTTTVKFNGEACQVPQIVDFLRSQVRGLEQCETPQTGFVPAQRAGRMIIGQYLLTGDDVLAGRKFPDAAARCAWPIEQWNAGGAGSFRYLPAGAHYEIPARCLRAARIENLFMAGKTISADVNAIASARVMGCCLATGAAAGNLAVRYLGGGA
jgi:hypothetical protein